MKISLVKEFNKIYDNVVIFAYENEKEGIKKYFKENISFVEKILDKNEFKGKIEEKVQITLDNKENILELFVIGLGKKEKLDNFELRRRVFSSLQGLKGTNTLIIADNIENSLALTETVLISEYKFDKYKSKKNPVEIKEKSFDLLANITEETLEEARNLIESVIITRNLVNEPANVIYPETLANKAVEYGRKYGFEVEVFEEDKIIELGMEAFLAVGRAAEAKPRFIIMRYKGGNAADEIIGLVGKGLTYDTGGLSLKPSASMDTMKSDMGGAATVIGVMSAIAKQGIKKNVTAVIAACENSVGGNAYRPGDIIGSMAGKTIEVLNTDAEGRLTLVDAVHYIITKENVANVIDVATLTGAALVALGETTTAALSNNDNLYSKMELASKESDERLWRLPNYPEYGKLIESKIADYKNIGGKWAGAITAGMFIEKFVGETPWIHLDIAGTAWADAPYDFYTLGGTGQMVKTLYNFVKKA